MQVSLSLFLVNPVLWYLIDRSVPGFLLSSAVGLLAASAAVLGLGPPGSMVVIASSSSSSSSPSVSSGHGTPSSWGAANDSWTVTEGGYAGSGSSGGGEMLSEGGRSARALAAPETLEAGMWMLTLLFCSCVCFGNIGRRLALDRKAKGRGRWGGIR